MREYDVGNGVGMASVDMIPIYVQCATAITKRIETPLLKAMVDETTLSLSKRLITHALILRHLRWVTSRLERITRRRQALKMTAVVFICL